MYLTLADKKASIVTYGRPLDPGQPSLLLIHGAGMNASVWTTQGRYFAYHGWSTVAPDLPGHGTSDGPALNSIDAMADWILQLVSKLGFSGIALAGHSMGSLVALAAAAKLGPACQSLILLGSTASMPVHPALLDAAANNRKNAGAMIANWGLPGAIEASCQPVPSSSLHWSVRRLLETGRDGALATSLAACNNYRHASEAAAKVVCRSLLLVGSRDRMAPVSGAHALADKLPHAEIRTIDAAEHMMLTEQPRATLRAMRDFLVAERVVAGALA